MKIKAKKVAPIIRTPKEELFNVFLDKDSPSVQFLRDTPRVFRAEFPILFDVIGKYSLVELSRGVKFEFTKEEHQEYLLATAKYSVNTDTKSKPKLKLKKKGETKVWWNEAPKFENYSKLKYERDNVMDIEPMLAKEYLNEEQLDNMCKSTTYLAEEKLDGVRTILQFRHDGVRSFSRNIVKKTNWRREYSDSLPHLRDMNIPELEGTILDGESFIPNKTFKEVSSILNCLPEEAIERQKTEGLIVLNAFDILFYKGEDVREERLEVRKGLLRDVVNIIQAKYGENTVREVPYFDNTTEVTIPDYLVKLYLDGGISTEAYPNFTSLLSRTKDIKSPLRITLNKKEFFEYVVLTGGEGIILKSKAETYKHKRGREYTKWKKFLTRDCVLIGFSSPTREFEGKSLLEGKTWDYWEDDKENIIERTLDQSQASRLGYTAVTKYHAKKWVGNMRIGVIVTEEDKREIAKTKNGKQALNSVWRIGNYDVLDIGECTGLTDEDRQMFTENRLKFRNSVVEILGNEIFTDTGKLRHPRFLRIREDKAMEDCTWKNHIN